MMKSHREDTLLRLVENASFETYTKQRFIKRIQEGRLTREENPTSHMCIYFAAFDRLDKLLFIGKHIKSGLWLFNGGHLDKGESLDDALYREMSEEWGVVQKIDIQPPSLFTITQIENPKKQICEWHYDIWYFIPCSIRTFHPSKKHLSEEFFEWGWKTVAEAKTLAKDRATLQGIEKINSQFLLY